MNKTEDRLHSHKNSFHDRCEQLSDEGIKEILRQLNSYQPEAAQAAINEAIHRGIIHSEQDLLAEEYNSPRPSFHIFPTIQKPEQKHKIQTSIHRVFYLAGIIPLIHGSLLYYQSHSPQWGVLVICSGILWLFCNFQLSRTNKKPYWHALLLLLLAGAGYTFYALQTIRMASVMDWAITVICCLLLVYCLFFLRSVKK